MERDIVDFDLDEWVDKLPGVDLSGRHILWRIAIISKLVDRRIEQISRKDGLSGSGLKLLLTLLRHPPEHELSPGQLARQGSLTSGTMTVLIDQLEERGLVQRNRNPRDRRALLVRLTPEGKQLIKEAHQEYLTEERMILKALDASERELLTNLLRKLLLSLDDRR